MRKYLLIALSLGTLHSYSSFATTTKSVEVYVCSDYIFATKEQHRESIQKNFKNEAYRLCGSEQWSIASYSIQPGVTAPEYCVDAQVVCN
jgi:hypothetical protein